MKLWRVTYSGGLRQEAVVLADDERDALEQGLSTVMAWKERFHKENFPHEPYQPKPREHYFPARVALLSEDTSQPWAMTWQDAENMKGALRKK